MAMNDVTRDAVLQAIAEFDELGEDLFLQRYGFGQAKKYFLVYKDRRYPSKAIVGVAHRFCRGTPLSSKDFVGGDATVRRLLEELGFDVLVLGE